MIVSFIEKFGLATRKELDDLITGKLSNTLTGKQKRNKIGNLITALRIAGIIENAGSYTKPK